VARALLRSHTVMIAIEGANHDAALRALIVRKLEAVSRRLRPAPVGVRVMFTDENGPKGGVGTRCGLTLDLPRRPELHAEEIAETHRLAFDLALASLERQALRDLEAARERRRRPKKYFVAKRLLEGDGQRERPA